MSIDYGKIKGTYMIIYTDTDHFLVRTRGDPFPVLIRPKS